MFVGCLFVCLLPAVDFSVNAPFRLLVVLLLTLTLGDGGVVVVCWCCAGVVLFLCRIRVVRQPRLGGEGHISDEWISGTLQLGSRSKTVVRQSNVIALLGEAFPGYECNSRVAPYDVDRLMSGHRLIGVPLMYLNGYQVGENHLLKTTLHGAFLFKLLVFFVLPFVNRVCLRK